MVFKNNHLVLVLADAILVALTGYGQTQSSKEAEQAGFNHCPVKPADMDQVNAVLAEAAQTRGR